MAKHIPFMRLTEREDEQGRVILCGSLGMTKVIGHLSSRNEYGEPTWLLKVVQPSPREMARRRDGYHSRQDQPTDGELPDDEGEGPSTSPIPSNLGTDVALLN